MLIAVSWTIHWQLATGNWHYLLVVWRILCVNIYKNGISNVNDFHFYFYALNLNSFFEIRLMKFYFHVDFHIIIIIKFNLSKSPLFLPIDYWGIGMVGEWARIHRLNRFSLFLSHRTIGLLLLVRSYECTIVDGSSRCRFKRSSEWLSAIHEGYRLSDELISELMIR